MLVLLGQRALYGYCDLCEGAFGPFHFSEVYMVGLRRCIDCGYKLIFPIDYPLHGGHRFVRLMNPTCSERITIVWKKMTKKL